MNRRQHRTRKQMVKHVLLALWMLLPLGSFGGGVVTNCTEANLRAAMAGGGLVTFACDGVITLSATITNLSDTVLDASGRQVTIDGSNAVRIFYVGPGVTFFAANLAISNGVAASGAGIVNDGGLVRLTSVGFFGNRADAQFFADVGFSGAGGAVLNYGGTLSATNCAFVANTALNRAFGSAWGGAIRNQAGQVTLRDCRFERNAARGSSSSLLGLPIEPVFGGAVHNDAMLTVEACSFDQNSARGGDGANPGGLGGKGSGGAIWNAGTAFINRSVFRDNYATGGRGDVGFTGGPGPSGSNGGRGGLGGDASGGAIFNGGSLTLNQNLLFANRAIGGSGGKGGAGGSGYIYATSGGAGGSGGHGSGSAIFNLGTVRMMNCTVVSNSIAGGNAGDGGVGGIGIKAGGLGGDGGNGGGAFGIVRSTNGLFLTNCTIALNFVSSGNGGGGGGGGTNTYPPIIQQSAGAAGTNGFVGGGLDGRNSWLVNSLLVNNASVSNCSGSLIDLGYNLSSDATCGFTNVGSLNSTDPLLGPLADNGGPTLTMALLAGSPAIDAGNSAATPPTDQRGIARPFGAAADIGAYEYTPLLRITRTLGNGLDILLRDGTPGQACRLLTSTNFSDWSCISTNQVGANGMSLLQTNSSPSEPQRFYKAVLP